MLQRLLELKNSIIRSNYYNQKPSELVKKEYSNLLTDARKNGINVTPFLLTTNNWGEASKIEPQIVPSYDDKEIFIIKNDNVENVKGSGPVTGSFLTQSIMENYKNELVDEGFKKSVMVGKHITKKLPKPKKQEEVKQEEVKQEEVKQEEQEQEREENELRLDELFGNGKGKRKSKVKVKKTKK